MRVSIEGNEREALPGSRITDSLDQDKRIQVTVMIRRKSSDQEISELIKDISKQKLGKREHLSREEFAEMHGADPADIAKMKNFAKYYNLDIIEINESQRRVVLEGTTNTLNKAFGVELTQYENKDAVYHGHTGTVQVAQEIAPVIEGVFGLDNQPIARPHSCQSGAILQSDDTVEAYATGTSYTTPQVAKLYNFPADVAGSNQCIAIIELNTSVSGDSTQYHGTGYKTSDMTSYFQQLGISKPNIISVSVDNGSNIPGINSNTDGETVLDIEVAGAVAHGAKIAVYFAPNTIQGFIDVISAAVHDTVNKPSVVSISWGNPENYWSSAGMTGMNQVFQDAAVLGVTVCCSTGDFGSSSNETDGLLHADFPGASPYVLACGGTRLSGSGSTITNEIVWNRGTNGATGGGISDVFAVPSYQADTNIPTSANPDKRVGRGIPDVAGNADPNTGYRILLNGEWGVFGGTSAVAPLWAGLVALLNQKLGSSVGFLNPTIYGWANPSAVFRDIASGCNNMTNTNGAYQACVGWDPCTGWGSPNGMKLLAALTPKSTPDPDPTPDPSQATIKKDRSIKICCDIMQSLVNYNQIVANLDSGQASASVLYTPLPSDTGDPVVTVTRIPVKYCPGCGMLVEVYGQVLPAPSTYTHATTHGGPCNDERCSFYAAPIGDATIGTCTFAQPLLSIGCWMTNDSVKSIVRDLRASVKENLEEVTTDT